MVSTYKPRTPARRQKKAEMAALRKVRVGVSRKSQHKRDVAAVREVDLVRPYRRKSKSKSRAASKKHGSHKSKSKAKSKSKSRSKSRSKKAKSRSRSRSRSHSKKH